MKERGLEGPLRLSPQGGLSHPLFEDGKRYSPLGRQAPSSISSSAMPRSMSSASRAPPWLRLLALELPAEEDPDPNSRLAAVGEIQRSFSGSLTSASGGETITGASNPTT